MIFNIKRSSLIFLLLFIFSCTNSFKEKFIQTDAEGRGLKIEITGLNNYQDLKFNEIKTNPLHTYLSKVTLYGTAYDKVKMDKITFTINGKSISSMGAVNSWQKELALVSGKNNICATITNDMGVDKTDCLVVYKTITQIDSITNEELDYIAGCHQVNGPIICVGGKYKSNASLYEFNGTTWSKIEEGGNPVTLPDARCCFETAYVNNKIYILGGLYPAGKENLVYDVTTKTFADFTHFQPSRTLFSAYALNNHIYCAGGIEKSTFNFKNMVNSLDTSQPTPSWGEPFTLTEKKAGILTLATNDSAYLIGGYNKNNDTLNSVEKCNAAGCTSLTGISENRIWPAGFIKDDFIYTMGGFDFADFIQSIEKYDINANSWQTIGTFHYSVYWAHSVYFNNKLYIIGGYNSQTSPEQKITTDVYTWQLME